MKKRYGHDGAACAYPAKQSGPVEQIKEIGLNFADIAELLGFL